MGSMVCCFQVFFQDYAEIIDQFPVQEDYVIVSSFPKAGMNWMKELTSLVLNKGDVDRLEKSQRAPYLERDAIWCQSIYEKLGWESSLRTAAKDPRIISTHLPWEFLPDAVREGRVKPKIIYIIRNPKDVMISWYHHEVLFMGYKGTLTDCVEDFTNDLTLYSPFWQHVEGYWKMKDVDNVLVIFFEDMVKRLPSVIQKVEKFLDTKIPAEKLPAVLEHLKAEQMQLRVIPNTCMDPSSSKLVDIHGVGSESPRCGRKWDVGIWKDELDEKSVALLDEWGKAKGSPEVVKNVQHA